MKNITVCILTAGVGSRMEEYTKSFNKALLPINKKASISLILEKFPKNTKFVIATGYKKKQVKEFLKTNHPKNKFNFININNYEGKGSGPGLSLLKCKKYLNKPFFFVSCDTLWNKNQRFIQNENWMGIPIKKIYEKKNYCNLLCKNKRVLSIYDKIDTKKNTKQFIGFAFIKDHKEFWEGIKKDQTKSKEPQVSAGFKNILKSKRKILEKRFDWIDIGTKEKYLKELIKHESFNFSKQSQYIYINEDRVTKYFENPQIIKNLVYKAKKNKKVYPKILKRGTNFLSYEYFDGQTYYNFYDPNKFKILLNYLNKNLWKKAYINQKDFQKKCLKFYRNKTEKRINLFKRKNKQISFVKNSVINNENVFSYNKLFKMINWKKISYGTPYHIHGDLQFDNILFNKFQKKFKLIDWRPDFLKNVVIGDIYYDFAKLLGGLILNYDFIKKNMFKISINNRKIFLRYKKRKNTDKCIKVLRNFAYYKGLSFKKIQIITGLIFLNMSPLHFKPFDIFLFQLGRLYLNNAIKNYENR